MTKRSRSMSEMISEMAVGFLTVGNSIGERQNRLNAACTAWNMACGSPEVRKRQLKQYADGYLRFNPQTGEPAARLLARLSEEALADVIYNFGEERFSRRIAREIVARRKDEHPVQTALELADLVRRAVPPSRPGGEKIDPATRTFQALRIAVNEELKSLDLALKRLPECLAPDGRFVILSYHSLEDRRVKEAFRVDPRLEALTTKPIRPSEAEVNRNPRSRSAKMRVAKRVR